MQQVNTWAVQNRIMLTQNVCNGTFIQNSIENIHQAFIKLRNQKIEAERTVVALQEQITLLRDQLNSANSKVQSLTLENEVLGEKLTELKEKLHQECTARKAVESHLSKRRASDKPVFQLNIPTDKEKYAGEYASTLICAVKTALKGTCKSANSPKRRFEDVLQGFLDANPTLCQQYIEHCKLIGELSKLSDSEAIHSSNDNKLLKKLGLELVTKNNGHYGVRFIDDTRYLALEAGSGSDRKRGRGGYNETTRMLHALFFSENKV